MGLSVTKGVLLNLAFKDIKSFSIVLPPRDSLKNPIYSDKSGSVQFDGIKFISLFFCASALDRRLPAYRGGIFTDAFVQRYDFSF